MDDRWMMDRFIYLLASCCPHTHTSSHTNIFCHFLLPGLQDGVGQTSQSLAPIKHFSTKLVSHTRVFVLQEPLSHPATTTV